MKRALPYCVAGAFVFTIAMLIWSFWWLMATPQGAERILDMAADAFGARLRVKQLKGSLFHGLELKGITLHSSNMEAKVEFIRLEYRPMLLLTGNLVADGIRVRGATISDRRPESSRPADLSWPILPAWTARLKGWISSIEVEDISYRRLERKPIVINRISTGLDWRSGRAGLSKLVIDAPAGRVVGNGSLGFREPRLAISLTAAPPKAVAGFSAFLIKADLKPAGGGEQTAGAVRIGALSSRKRWLELSAGMGVTRSSLQFRNIAISEPGRKGRLSGSGNISFEKITPSISLALKSESLDLSPEIPSLPPLSGTLNLAGSMDSYRGTFSFSTASSGWRNVQLSGTFAGDSGGAKLELDRGTFIGGTLTGSVKGRWDAGPSLSLAIHGRNLNPARITPDWDGVVNLDLTGDMRSSGGGRPVATVSASFPQSRLRGRKLTGELSASLRDGNLILDRLTVQGKGFDIRASGDLARSIAFTASVSDLSGLVPGTGGMLKAKGELLRRNGFFGLTAAGQAEKLRTDQVRAQGASFKIELEATPERKFSAQAKARAFSRGSFQATDAQLDAFGTPMRHVIRLDLRSVTASLQAQMEGSYRSPAWQGRLSRLTGKDGVGPWSLQQPADIRISDTAVTLTPLILNGNPGERVEILGETNRQFSSGSVEARWQRLNLARIGPWLSGARITGTGSGHVSLLVPRKGAGRVSGSMDLSGSFASGRYQVDVRSGSISLETRGRILEGQIALDMGRQGRLKGRIEAQPPVDGLIPRSGNLDANLEGLDLRLLKPWLPAGLALEGTLGARTAGMWGPGAAIRLTGQASVAGGLVRQQRKGGELTATLRTATLSWDWRGNDLKGEVALELSDTGHIGGRFMFPLPARLPAAMNPGGPVSVSIAGKMRENGLLTALFPGMVQESRGELDIDLRVGDTWRNPVFTGQMLFSRAGMYLPRAGIRLADLQASATLEKGGIRIGSFSARSGSGVLSGSGFIRMTDWKPSGYQASLKGDRFQLINIPELQIVGSPRLDIEGTGKKITVRGELAIPELMVAGRQTQTQVKPSTDVLVIDAPPKEVRAFPFTLDMQVRVLFGDKVFVKAEGIDARLTGGVDLTFRGPDDIRGRGEIRVAEGSYRAYGVNLKIAKGRLVYTGGAVDRPNLDILALRTVGEVKAGVIIGGNLKRPAIRLYSEPALSDSDIMGYIVLGHPISGDKGQIGDVMQAAGLLLSAGQTTILQEQIGRRFGIDSIGVETEKTDASRSLVTAVSDKKDASRSLVTVGKYLTPKLFISYGRSLFSPTSYLRARYNFSERWEIETWTGTESGADLYYKINFN